MEKKRPTDAQRSWLVRRSLRESKIGCECPFCPHNPHTTDQSDFEGLVSFCTPETLELHHIDTNADGYDKPENIIRICRGLHDVIDRNGLKGYFSAELIWLIFIAKDYIKDLFARNTKFRTKKYLEDMPSDVFPNGSINGGR